MKASKAFSENKVPLLEWVLSNPDLTLTETLWHGIEKQL